MKRGRLQDAAIFAFRLEALILYYHYDSAATPRSGLVALRSIRGFSASDAASCRNAANARRQPFGKLTAPSRVGYNQLLVLTYEENISTKEKAQDARARLSVADAEQEREEGAETADVQGPRAPDCVAARDATA